MIERKNKYKFKRTSQNIDRDCHFRYPTTLLENYLYLDGSPVGIEI